MPDAEPHKMVIHFVESNGEIVGSMELEVGGRPREEINFASVAGGDEAFEPAKWKAELWLTPPEWPSAIRMDTNIPK